MKPEAKLWQEIRAPISYLGQVNRIESHATSIGVPDVELGCINGNQWWIELKAQDPKKGIAMRPAQKGWHLHRAKRGGKSLVLTKTLGNNYMLHWGDIAAKLPAHEMDEWAASCLYWWNQRINWEQFKDFLYETKSR